MTPRATPQARARGVRASGAGGLGRRPARRIVAALVLAAFPAGGRAEGPPPRNLLLVTLDTTRADHVGAYGHRGAATPNLDALAAQGTLFEQAFTSSPMTLPAHATILTGLEPPEHGLRVNGRSRLGDGVPTIAEVLSAAGYQTGAFVAAFVLNTRFGLARGFSVYDDDLTGAQKQDIPEPLSVYRPGNVVVGAALAWLERAAGVGAARPFFCWVHLYDPHQPYYPHSELAGTRFAGTASYDGEIAFMDRQVGALLGFLHARGLADRTLVVVVGDHGEGLEEHGEVEHGYLLSREALHVPLMVALPGVVREGSRIREVVSTVDVFATVLDLVGIAVKGQGRGRSLRRALAGEPIASRPSYAETTLPYATYRWSPLRSLTTKRWKYVRSGRPELYDRSDDPTEHLNLARRRPEEMAVAEKLLATLEARMRPQTADRVTLDAEAHRRLAALGYVVGSGEAPAASSKLRDVKDMLPVKHLEARLNRGIHDGSVSGPRALAIARKLVRRSPESPSFHHNLGVMLAQAGDRPGAIEQLAEAVRIDPERTDAETELAGLLAAEGRLDEAVGHYEAALRAAPDLVDARVGLANTLAAQGRLDEAIAQYTKTLERDPSFPEAHFNLANTLARAGRLEAAAAHYEAALRTRPVFALAHHNLARVLLRLARSDDALSHWQQALRLDPDLAPAHAALARALAGRDAAAAIHHATEAVRLRPETTRYALALAWLLATSGDARQRDGRRAVALAEPAVRASGAADPSALDTLAAAYAETRQFDASIATAEKAVAAAETSGQTTLAADIRERLALYTRRKPYRERAATAAVASPE